MSQMLLPRRQVVKRRRLLLQVTLFLTFVAVNLFSLVYWHSNFIMVESEATSTSSPEAIQKILRHEFMVGGTSGEKRLIDAANYETSPRTGRAIKKAPNQIVHGASPPKQPPSSHNPSGLSERQDRLETLDRLKGVLEINDTVELLKTLNTGGNNIPLWSDIERLYGITIPHILGLNQCQLFQDTVPKSQRWIAPAGLFHTGTNLITSLMTSSCHGISFQGQVPYGKHNPLLASLKASYRVNKTSYGAVTDNSQILPIVMVRHPLDWMKSMCQQKYAVSWENTSTTPNKLPCPSLDVPISVNFFQSFDYDHLSDLWHQWYQEYLDYDRPRLIVRLEDLVYAPQDTIQAVCECVGGTFQYQPQSMEKRKGGREWKDPKADNFLIKAWARHSHSTIHHTLASSEHNQQLFSRIVKQAEMQRLLESLSYNIV